MASEKYFENFWDCPNCRTENISALRKMRCPNCGTPKTTQDFESARMVEITDEYGLKLAKSGKNWACSYCHSANLDVDQKCSGCSADRSEEVNGAFRVEDVTEKVKDYEIVEKESGGQAKERRADSPDKQSPRLYKRPPKASSNKSGRDDDSFSCSRNNWEDSVQPNRTKRLSQNQWIALGAVFLVLAISGFVYWTKCSYPGELTSFYWERNVQVEIYKTLSESGWDHPLDAFNVNSRSKVHHYDPIYESKTVTEQEPYTVTTYVSKTNYVNNGNGSTRAVTTQVPKHTTKYRSVTRTKQVKVGERPIYRTYYDYNVNRWVYHKTLYSNGEDKNKIYWPEFIPETGGRDNLGATRLGTRNETLYVYVKWKVKEENRCDKFKVDSYEGRLIGDKLRVHYLLGLPTSLEFDLKGER